MTDLYPKRRKRLQEVYGCDNVYDSLEEMLKQKANDLDAVAVFSGALDHVKHTRMCFERGLHVIAAVPACFSMEEAYELKEQKEKTGLRYMMAETSYYNTACIYARELFQKGGFGELFYSEVEYYHDVYREEIINNPKSNYYHPDGSVSWRQGFPPMHYPTHALGYIVGVTGERIVRTSALGWGDPEEMAMFKSNPYRNPFSNSGAWMQTDQGHIVRCNMFWHIAAGGERANWFGEKGTFYMTREGIHRVIWGRADKQSRGGDPPRVLEHQPAAGKDASHQRSWQQPHLPHLRVCQRIGRGPRAGHRRLRVVGHDRAGNRFPSVRTPERRADGGSPVRPGGLKDRGEGHRKTRFTQPIGAKLG